MHERNIYKTPPDFKKLSEKYECFARFVRISSDGRGHINFKDPEALRELTYTLLKEDFGIVLEIPLDRLIPTLSLRLNYIHWIEDLLSIDKTIKSRGVENECVLVRGFDIGCGASCIYPILGVKINDWKFTATEIDEQSFDYAANNINKNNMNKRILLRRGKKESILKELMGRDESYDFCMCNPPFFADREEACGDISRSDRRPLPVSLSTATENESITDGGEVAFVKKLVDESLHLKDRIRWYTSMLGKKKTLKTLKRYLNNHQVPCISSTTFQQGRTTRWAICWSFCTEAKLNKELSALSMPKSNINIAPFCFMVQKAELEKFMQAALLDTDEDIAATKIVFREIKKYLNDLEICFQEAPVFGSVGSFEFTLLGEAFKNTWIHQRRQKRFLKKMKSESSQTTETKIEQGEQLAINVKTSDFPQVHTLPAFESARQISNAEKDKTEVVFQTSEVGMAEHVDMSNICSYSREDVSDLSQSSTERLLQGNVLGCDRKRKHDESRMIFREISWSLESQLTLLGKDFVRMAWAGAKLSVN
eukprot:gene14337-15833_t